MGGYENNKKYESGVSESIGFVLIFTMVIVGIGLVTLYGYPILAKQQVSTDVQIMEKNMIVLQNDIKSISYKSVPYKETSLKVGGGSLTVRNASFNTTPSFKIWDNNNIFNTSFKPGQLHYESVNAQTVIDIENGAVVTRTYFDTGSVMLASPRWFSDYDPVTSNTATVIYFIGMNSTNTMVDTSVGTVRMQLTTTNFTQLSLPMGDTVFVQYIPNPATDFSQAWRDYIVNSLGWIETPPNSGIYQLPPSNTLVVESYDILVKGL